MQWKMVFRKINLAAGRVFRGPPLHPSEDLGQPVKTDLPTLVVRW